MGIMHKLEVFELTTRKTKNQRMKTNIIWWIEKMTYQYIKS